jgi:hypothetical protein
MKKIVLVLIGLLFCSGLVSAYQIDIEAPASLAVGKPLVVTGTTTLGTGTPVDVVLYFQSTSVSTEIKRIPVYVMADKTFKAIFDTTGLKTGSYKVEVPSPAGSDSVFMRAVTIYDRSEDITFTTPLDQDFTGKIYCIGTIKGLENSGIQVEVIAANGLVIFGPQFVHTDNAAHFAFEVPLPAPGIYEVSFTDANGYIGSRTINTNPSASGSITSVTASATKSQPIVSAHARASRDSPAYFLVEAGTGPVILYTSKSLDWVIEYVDDRGILYMKNDQGDQYPEKVVFTGNGETIYVKVYPYKYSVSADVFLYGENANSIIVSRTVPAPFIAAGDETPVVRSSPVLFGIAVLSAGIAFFLVRKRDP